jgi:NAD-dependent SIR2 family protein deacetylase
MTIAGTEEAAAVLAAARRVVFLTSAGMSAESGIPTFRDRDGYWRRFPPFATKGLEAQDLASPWAFRNCLPHAWAFYEWRRRNAAANTPHPGYDVIHRWMASRFPQSFIHTTNTDGYHLRAGAPTDRVREVHGSMWRLQCLRPCAPRFWRDEQVPLCDLDEAAMEASGFPTCPDCGGVARPHILMFGDPDYVGHRDQDLHWRTFSQLPVEVALLIGSSGAVPANDVIAMQLQTRGTRVITINPDPAAGGMLRQDVAIVAGAQAALAEIDLRLDDTTGAQTVAGSANSS